MRRALLLAFFFSVAIICHAQVSGRVTNARSGKPIPEAEVFVHQRSVSILCDADGRFSLNGIDPGFIDLIVFKKGFQLFKSSMRLDSGKAYAVNLGLSPARLKTRGQGTEQQRTLIIKTLVGEGRKANLTNQQSLQFGVTPEGWIVHAEEPLLFLFPELGYEVRYYLEEGVYRSDKLSLTGYYTVIELPATGSGELKKQLKFRHEAYVGSLRHFMKSLVAGVSSKDYSIQGGEGSISVTKTSVGNYRKISFGDSVSVTYRNDSDLRKMSTLTRNGSIQVNPSGILLNSASLKVQGSMASEGIIQLPPLDYSDETHPKTNFENYLEKVYVQTDKPYYYPGEPLWFKGYINYGNKAYRDSLSRVVYVELIAPGKIIVSKALRIDSGLFVGELLIPDSLHGMYRLRAYTQLSRNFGDDQLFQKAINVLRITEKINPEEGRFETVDDQQLEIQLSKPRFKPREKITLKALLHSNGTMPNFANLSMAVTDAVQVVPVMEARNILSEYAIIKDVNREVDFTFPVEYGCGFAGQFMNDTGKPERTNLTIIKADTREVSFAETNEQGVFNQSGFIYSDTATFLIKSDKATGKPYGQIKLLPRLVPDLSQPQETLPFKVMDMNEPQRLISEYEVPKDTKLLNEVEVRASRIRSEETNSKDYRTARPYGSPDYVLQAKDINTSYGNLLYAMQGRFPGLVVRLTEDGWKIYTQRSVGNSLMFMKPILVMINDVAMSGEPADILSTINPNTVESIEVTTRVNVLYGSSGQSGVISIHTKQGLNPIKEITPDFIELKVPGYSRSRSFTYPHYDEKETDASKADYRATIYWNPQINCSSSKSTEISFFAADLSGRYKVTIEGITNSGTPIHETLFFEVGEN
ncbi:MAG: carboxypeptidase regulatory-like domain-containing protein [Cyclobacteriaceae bacterium]|nr:hypothetical protein [Cytophagales bacterium]HNP76130.1 carboxypeptidase regulatory-like domain-containing protein [Cyclobacteriaceae bacterium]